MRICKEYRFESAHHLPGHRGPCARVHGHSYRLEVEVEGEVSPPSDETDACMVMDFGELDGFVQPIIDKLDHHDLNEMGSYFGYRRSTAEALVSAIVSSLKPRLASRMDGGRPVRLSRVRLWETEKAYAEWDRRDDASSS